MRPSALSLTPPSSSLPVPSGGTIRNPITARDLLALPLGRRLTGADVEPVALAVLLARLLARMGVTGTLQIDRDGESACCPVMDGSCYLTDSERARLRGAFLWPEATYRFEGDTPDCARRTRVSPQVLAAEGVRAACKECTKDELLEGFGDRQELAPVLRPDRAGRLGRLGLDGREKRFVESNLDGRSSMSEAALRGGVGPTTALQVLVLLTVFEILSFDEVLEREGTSLSERVAQRAARMCRGNHFEAMGVHWSALGPQIEEAYEQLSARLRAGGEWDQADPDSCRGMRERLEEAYSVLSDSAQRLAHRAEQYPDKDTEALDDLLRRRGQALELKGAKGELRETLSKRSELAAMRTAQAQQRASLKPRSIKSERKPDGGDRDG
ncbi:MAG: hypothetical protein JRI23_06195 [Deltaproteobacteria bacterium]|nr:hypothetical protein [Deltaproteobacteria bacterium]MBW2531165.1 hypothetical protein [Deltaproteobacteria bacterium]